MDRAGNNPVLPQGIPFRPHRLPGGDGSWLRRIQYGGPFKLQVCSGHEVQEPSWQAGQVLVDQLAVHSDITLEDHALRISNDAQDRYPSELIWS